MSQRTVLVTGGASGVGRVLVELFHAEGDRVIAVDVSKKRLDDLAADLPDVVQVCADLATVEGAEAAFAATDGKLDVLCNNAGIADLLWVDEISEERWDQVVDVNLKAPFMLSRLAVPVMVEAGGGVITNTASISSIRGARAGVAYTAAKAGVVGLTQNIAATFGPKGIRCNAVCPGTVETNIHETMGPRPERAAHFATRDRDKPPPAEAREIADVIHFLATPAASRVNGAVITVDGGWTAY